MNDRLRPNFYTILTGLSRSPGPIEVPDRENGGWREARDDRRDDGT
jgi:ribosome modulation factor